MKKPFGQKIAVLALAGVLLAALPALSQIRYHDEVFSQFTMTGSIQFGTAPNIFSQQEKLRLDLYQPTGDTAPLRPAIIFIHGGSWSMGGRGEMAAWCETFARRGYVTATADYRTGIWKPTYNYIFEAGLRSCQDVKAAVRWLRANAATYRIDPRQIFLGGSSAGSMTALIVAYLDNDEIPAGIDTVKWGNVEGNSGNAGFSSEVQGVLNYCGAIFDTLWIDAGEPAVASFHGKADPIVPYETFKSPDFGIVLSGSAPITRTALRLGITTDLAGIPDMGHGVNSTAMMDSLINFERDFLFKLVSSNVSVQRDPDARPHSPSLRQNYPNPFNAATTLRFSLAHDADASLTVCAIDGRRISVLAKGRLSAGEHTVRWQADDLPSGVYMIVLEAEGLRQTRKIALVK